MFIPGGFLEAFDGDERPAVFLEATPLRCLLVWWGFLWRIVVSTIVFGSIAFLLVSEVLGIENDLSFVSCFAGALIMSAIPVTGRVLEKRFSGFRLALVKNHPHLF